MSGYRTLGVFLFIMSDIYGSPVDSSSKGPTLSLSVIRKISTALPVIASTCYGSQFRCAEGICIPHNWRCDFHKDCLDGSDELGCEGIDKLCPSNALKCDGYRCVISGNICDGVAHCTDGADERDCKPQLSGPSKLERRLSAPAFDFFPFFNAKSLSITSEGISSNASTASQNNSLKTTDTKDTQIPTKLEEEEQSRESDQTLTITDNPCPTSTFQCPNEACIPHRWVCDGVIDCLNGIDEENCTDKTCPTNTFQCSNAVCIPNIWVCDGEKDCIEGSDEGNCPGSKCPFEENFRCSDGLCIPAIWLCDKDKDCSGGEDEANCTRGIVPPKCGNSTFKCSSGECIPKTLVCNGEHDCTNGDDEQACVEKNEVLPGSAKHDSCDPKEFLCKDGLCIDKAYVCDGDNDCNGGEDELNCSKATTLSKSCREDEFMCLSDSKCISISLQCNREKNCDDLSDEIRCGNRDCFDNEFRCKTTEYCVFESWRCDNQNDCLDNSDEVFCPACDKDKFTCPDGLCLPLISRCDTLIDCYDGSDELNCTSFHTPALCTTKEFTCKSNLKCINARQVCNHVSDCPDNSDEANCNKELCKPNEFRCRLSGNCLLQEWVCDGYEDCFDGSDENGCKDGNLRNVSLPPSTDGNSSRVPLPSQLPPKGPTLPVLCDSVKCSSCFTENFLNLSTCPVGFEKFREKCLWIHPFPRIWLRAKDMCQMKGGVLAEFSTQMNYTMELYSYIKERSLEGWNYWTGRPIIGHDIQTRPVDIPSWFLNGRTCSGTINPMYAGQCFFLHNSEFIFYKGSNCNDSAGFICEWKGGRI